MHHANSRILLPSAVLTCLNRLTASDLKVCLYLCSVTDMAAVTISAATISRDTHVALRSTYQSLRTLQKEGLLKCHGKAHPGTANTYSIVFDAEPGDAEATCEPDTSEIAVRPSPAPIGEATVTISAPSGAVVQKPAPSVEELLAAAYRRVDQLELQNLREMLSDEHLRRSLQLLIAAGGVAPDVHFGFLRRVLMSIDG